MSAARAEPEAWQERQQTIDGWTSWYDASATTAVKKGRGFSEVINGIEYQWRPLYAAQPSPTMADVIGRAYEEGLVHGQGLALKLRLADHGADAIAAGEPTDAALTQRAELMRLIDAYAFDYQRDGKLAATRLQVERALLASSAGTPHGAREPELHLPSYNKGWDTGIASMRQVDALLAREPSEDAKDNNG